MTTTLEQVIPVLATPAEALAVARELAGRIVQTAAARDRERSAPHEELAAIDASGLLGIAVPAAHGGPDLPRSTVVEVFRILARADSAVAQQLLAHFVVQHAISGLGDTAPAPRIFADVLAGGRIGNATVERTTKRSVDRETRVRKQPDGTWRLDGLKYYATGSLGAAWIAVAALDDDGYPATVFVRPGDAGVTLRLEDWSSFGQRASFSGTVRLEGVVVDAELVLPEGPPPEELPPLVLGAYDQALHAAIDVGIARAALEDGAAFVRDRSRPWFESGLDQAADEPHVLRRFGELTTRLHALEALLERGARLVDEALAAPELTDENTAAATLAVAEAKALAQELAPEIASGIFELAGTSATDEAHDLDRHWRNVRTHSLHDPARWKYVHIGNHLLNGVNPPRLGVLY
ncbi:SfnB family sulfur acquisition oxidoreductase [Cryptosporangium aurantiacum]|uniref:Sulfur acquisition oxidoreductase, SfnB family n=1 Tax=Cryptosporangium aurantiacum TaxID=134849 RepID=A0A1M7KCK1_9ACTN|nr:SfnB family sulfur acquisition oxidoreductase [Cryptosporangium aurantiacum]SHM62970.1 sulfur acquisition oxidoreductase, SfnB family [Cryptosporangium aurantiacum]